MNPGPCQACHLAAIVQRYIVLCISPTHRAAMFIRRFDALTVARSGAMQGTRLRTWRKRIAGDTGDAACQGSTLVKRNDAMYCRYGVVTMRSACCVVPGMHHSAGQ